MGRHEIRLVILSNSTDYLESGFRFVQSALRTARNPRLIFDGYQIVSATFALRMRASAVTSGIPSTMAVDAISRLSREIEELSPRIEVLLALIPQGTAMQLRGLFETAEGKARGVQERLGNLLGNPDTNPGSKTFQPAQYAQMQGAYQQVYYEAQEPLYLLHAVQTAVQSLESNPQEQIDFQQLTRQSFAQGQRSISQPGYPSESTWAGR